MAYFDRILPVSFSGYRFPAKNFSIKGSLRHHAHVYPHAPGAALETMGRNLYEFRLEAMFHETLPKYPNLLETAATLRTLFEGGLAWDLNIPHIGTISAKCIDWEDNLVASARSGYDSKLTFLEDQSDQFLADKLVTTSPDVLSAADTLTTLLLERDTTPFYPELTVLAREATLARENELLNDLLLAVDAFTSLDDQAQLYTDLVVVKAMAVETACARARDGAKSLGDYRSYKLLNAMAEVQAKARERRKDALRRGGSLETFETPQLMAVSQVAAFLYGDTSRAVDLLKLNSFADAMAIPSGTLVKFYPDLANAA